MVRKNNNQAESIREYQDLTMGGDVSLGMLKADLRVTSGERDQLKAENEALRSAALAAREFIIHEAEVRGLLDENGQVSHRHPRRQATIAKIDAAMAKEASHD